MSKIMLAKTHWLRDACSKGLCSVDGLAVIPIVIYEQMHSKFYNNLKYVHELMDFYKHVKVTEGKRERFVKNPVCLEAN